AYVDGGFVDRARGIRVEADGALTRLPAGADEDTKPGVPAHGRAAAALATALSGCALPLLAGTALLAPAERDRRARTRFARGARGSSGRAVALIAGTALATVLLFHAA